MVRVGSIIALVKMEDPFSPIEPGTLGEVRHIDHIGTLHVSWHNGRRLGVVPGEDIYEVISY